MVVCEGLSVSPAKVCALLVADLAVTLRKAPGAVPPTPLTTLGVTPPSVSALVAGMRLEALTPVIWLKSSLSVPWETVVLPA